MGANFLAERVIGVSNIYLEGALMAMRDFALRRGGTVAGLIRCRRLIKLNKR
jgi:hypothetical protein